MSVERHMIEKTYGELVIGDCVWIMGSLVRVEQITPGVRVGASRSLTITRFHGTILRAGPGVFDVVGASLEFSGFPYCAVLTEVVGPGKGPERKTAA